METRTRWWPQPLRAASSCGVSRTGAVGTRSVSVTEVPPAPLPTHTAPLETEKLVTLHSAPGVFSLGVPVDHLFFIGNQLVATSHTGKVGVWNAVTQHWQVGSTFNIVGGQ